MAKKAPGFNQTLDPIGDPGQGKKAPGFGAGFASPLVPTQQPTNSTRLATGVPANADLENYMATQQGKWELAGKALGQTLSEAVLGTIEAGSYLADVEQMIDKLKGDEQEYTNWLAESMKDAKESLSQDTLQVHKTFDAQEGFAPGDATWWAVNTPQTIGTALSLMVPAAGVAGVAAKGAKILGASSKGINLAKGLSATVASRYAESTMEANNLYERSYNELLAKGETDETARLKAGEAASKVWNSNWVFAVQDFFQYSSILKGFGSAAKGAKGLSVGEIIKQGISEAGEEAGQFIVSEEAHRTAMEANADYFGEGFSKRLYDYVRDPEFKASTLLGAVGGGVFTAAGPIANKISDVGQATGNFLQDQVKSITKKGVQKEVANYTGDTATSMAIDDETFASQVATHITKGTLPSLMKDYENLQGEPNLSPEARETISTKIKDLEFIQNEQARLKGSSFVPAELHNDILFTKLEQRNLGKIHKSLIKETDDLIREAVDNKELPADLSTLKELQLRLRGYQELAKTNPQFTAKVESVQKELNDQLELVKIAYPSVDLSLVTSNDEQLVKKYSQLVSTDEKINALKQDILTFTTKEGIEGLKKKRAEEKINKEAALVLEKKDATKEELLQAQSNATDPELKSKINDRYQERIEQERKQNTDQTAGEVRDFTPEELYTDIDIDPDEFDPDSFTPPDEDITFDPDKTIITEEYGGLTFNQVKRQFGAAEANKLLDRLQAETPTEETSQPEQKKKKTQIKAQSRARELGTVPVWLKVQAGEFKGKEFIPSGETQKYYDNINNKEVDVTEVFATDANGHLLIDTPQIKEGDEVILKVVDDGKELEFPYTLTPGFRPDNLDNVVINGYRVDKNGNAYGKPLFQLPSADNRNVPNKEGLATLRGKVINSQSQTFKTKITSKSIGDFRRSSNLKSLEVLGFDYNQNKGNWTYGKTPHNPILILPKSDGRLVAPNLEAMTGITKEVIESVDSTLELPIPEEYSQGAIFTPRTAPNGSKRLAMLKPRKLNDTEIAWINENLGKKLEEKALAEIDEVLHIPQHFASFLTGTKKEKKPGILKASRRRLHLVSTTENDIELVIPVKNRSNGWIIIKASGEQAQAAKFIAREPFKFDVITEKGERIAITDDSSKIKPETLKNIYDTYEQLIKNSFRNIRELNLNSEILYTDPATGKEHGNYYNFILDTNAIQTDLPGSKTLAFGEDSSYSFENAGLHLDPNGEQVTIEVTEDEIVEDIKNIEDQPKPDTSTPLPPDEDPIEKYYGFEGKPREATVKGFDVITEKELSWFKDAFGEEFLSIAKGVDRIIANGGVEAFGIYHNAMVTLADFAETGTLYHEAFHFALENTLSQKQREKLLNAAAKKYGIKRSFDKGKNSQKLRAVDYQLRAVEILQSKKADEVFRKGDKNGWDLDKILTELAIPKEQKALIKSYNTRNKEEIITSLLANYSYTVEINTATGEKINDRFTPQEVFFYNGDRYEYEPENDVTGELRKEQWLKNEQPTTKNEYENALKKYQETNNKPTQYYSNLTVPGGTNYTENEIATPSITPSIKGHAQFSTDKGIGWFRSDEQAITSKTETEKNSIRESQLRDMGYSEEEISEMTEADTGSQPKVVGSTKTRRILELQSDLFQKGRDKKDLITKTINEDYELTLEGNTYFLQGGDWINITKGRDASEEEVIKLNKLKDTVKVSNENNFLQLLNKDNNWVTFFVKSIIQDSAKKGYEKVLFPKGDTAAKIEGHQTLEEFKKTRENEIKKSENKIKEYDKIINTPLTEMEDIFGKPELEKAKKQKESALAYIDTLKQELADVESGQTQLSSIARFYEENVTNVLKKNGYNPIEIIDEYGNKWNQVAIEVEKANEVIYYHKAKNLGISEKDFKNNISVKMHRELVLKNKRVSKDKLDGNRTIRHTEDRSPHSPEKRKLIVETNHRYLTKLNERQSNGVLPFIIEKKTSTKEKNKDGDTIIIPNYTIKVNEEYLDIEWEKFKLNNQEDEESIERGEGEGIQLSLFSIPSPKNHKESAIDLGHDTLEDVAKKTEILQKSLNATVTMNPDLPPNVYGRIKGREIEINPNYVKKDTVIHEFGHLFVDLLGGMNNNFIKRGRKILEGSDIEAEVIKNYGDELSGELLDKEILTTAIGIEGANLYDLQKTSPFSAWLKILLNKIKLFFGKHGILGIEGNVALELAQQMLNNKVNKSELTYEVSDMFQNSKSMGNEKYTSTEDEKLSKLSNKILDRVKVLQAKYKHSDKESAAKFKDSIKKLVTILETNRDAKGIIRYVDELEAQSDKINARIDAIYNSKDSLFDKSKSIKNLGTFIGSFELISQVRDFYEEVKREAKNTGNTEVLKILEEKGIEESLSISENKLTTINSNYRTLRINHLADVLLPGSNKMNYWYRDQYERDFYESEGGYNSAKLKYGKDKVKEAKLSYISSKMEENKELIERAEKNYLLENLTSAPKDLEFGILGQLAVDPRSMDDALISEVVNMLDRADYNAMKEFIKDRNEALTIYEEYKTFRNGESNQKKLYEGLIEKVNGKETNHLVGKYLSSFRDVRNKWYNEFKEKNGRSPNALEKKNFYDTVKPKYENPQWKALNELREKYPDDNHPQLKMYNYLMDKFKEKDKYVGEGYKLNIYPSEKFPTYKLPSIEKNTVELLYEKGLLSVAKDKVRKSLSKTSNDTEFSEGGDDVIAANFKKVIVDESGKENQKVPIHFRGGIRKGGEQSFDLVGIHLIDHSELLNHREKSKIGNTVELIADQAGAREIKRRRNGKTLMNALGREGESYVPLNGIDSASYKALHSIVQDRLYGLSSIDAGDIKIGNRTVNINKAANSMMAWTGNTMLILNYMSGGVNLVQGKYQNFLEGAGGTIYNGKNLRNAEIEWLKDSGNILGDIGLEKPNSKTNLLMELFDADSNFNGLEYKLSEDNRFKRLAKTSSGHFINHSTEAYIQGTAMYAVLDSIKVKDSEGKNIPLHEAYEVVNGELSLKKGINLEGNKEDLEYKVSRKIKEVIKHLHGNYDSNNQAMAQRYVGGKLAFMLRKWLVVGTQRRWRGINYAFKKNENRTIEDIAFNSILEKDMEGYYSTAIRFLYNSLDELKTLQFGIIAGEWNKLTDEERSNIRKTIIDISTMIGSITAATIIAGLAEGVDDDDKEMYYMAAYIFRRHYSELRFYSSASEFMNILRTPAASMSMIDRTGELASQLLNPAERYVKGKRKGELKIARKFKKVIPVMGQSDRSIADAYKWLDQ